MPILPPRRWYQFRLTTWFVLVAILGWAMTYWPWVVIHREVKIRPLIEEEIGSGSHSGTFTYTDLDIEIPNRAILWPALALATFVGWKAAWAVGQRMAGRKVEQA